MGLKQKRGVFFSIDALIALLIILLVILIAVPSSRQTKIESKIDADILRSLSSITAEQFDNSYVQSLISTGVIKEPNKSLLEQIGNFYVTNTTIASRIADEFLSGIKSKENIGIWLENNLVSSKNSSSIESAKQIEASRQIISGVMLGQNVTGYSARAFLLSSSRNSYSYFGGYVGDGNLTLVSEYNGTITDADIELASNEDFQIYINGQYAGNYTKSPSKTIPSTYELSTHLNKFVSGKNVLEFVANGLYIAGGFLKIKYQSESIASEKKQYLQGVNGLINIYDGLYIPGTPSSINISLDLESNFTTFLNIGNVTVYNSTTNARENITLSNAFLSSVLNYSRLANKTTPIRLGLRNVSLIYSNQRIDVFSVVDLSGSMQDNCPGGSADPGETPCKINDAKNATDDLINVVLNISGNRVGLVGFEDYAKKPDFHNLSNNSITLKNISNNVWNADGSTCICCGILKANSCFDSRIFYDNFNNQTNGTNPSGWTVSEPGSSRVDITSDSLEGDRSTWISRAGTNNPSMVHIFNPQENQVDVEFLVNHTTGTGRFRLEIEGLDSAGNYQDYAIIKMYTGQIRNNDAAVTAYNLNATYRIKAELVPGSNTYSLYVNNILINSTLPTSTTLSNVARLSFKTETSQISYKIDGVNVTLKNALCDLQENRSREMIVMSDGVANQACGLDPSPDWDGDSSTTNDPQDQAIQAACIAKSNHNITVHSIALDVTNGSLAEQTMQGIAACGNGGFYTSNLTQLKQIYSQITNNILATYLVQGFNSSIPQTTRLYPDSFISLVYPQETEVFGIPITIEKPFSNATSVNFSIPSEATATSVTAVSYSGDLWTSRVILNNQTVYDIDNYGSNYIELGDPYAIKIDPRILLQNNTLSLTVASSPTNETTSVNNKLIYTIVRNMSAYSPITANRNGCSWSVYFEDNTNATILIPSNYTGSDTCIYSPSSIVYNSNDALQSAVYNLFRQLDLDLDGRIDFLFNQNEVTIDTTDVQGIPFPWSTEIQVRRWI